MSLRPALLLGLVAVLRLLPAPVVAAEAPEPAPVERVIVRWRDALPAALPDGTLRELSGRAGVTLRAGYRIGPRLHVLQLDDSLEPGRGAALLAALRADPRVEYAQADGRVRVRNYLPSDPLFADQWYLQDQQVAATRANRAWSITRGGATAADGPIVAVIDTGVRFDHPDLRRASAGGKLLAGYDFVSPDRSGVFATANDGDGWDADPSDPGDFITAQDLTGQFKDKGCGAGPNEDQPARSSWHGTRVSGLVAADSDNALGIAGTGFNTRILPVRALGKCGGYDSDVLAAMYWSAGLSVPATLLAGSLPPNPTPARVLNLSLGGVGDCSALYTEAVRAITAAGVLVVVAAGNEGTPVDSPANCSGALGVAGLRHAGTKVGYSNLGPEIGIAAPAGNCVNITAGAPCLFALDTTTDSGLTTPVGPAYTNRFDTANFGTSFSAPLVSAAAALMLQVNPGLTPGRLTARIKATARAFPTTSETTPPPPQCRVPTGRSDVQDSECACTTAVCGAGMLDIEAAVRDAQRPVAIAAVTGTVAPGSTLTLDGRSSAAATGRSIASYRWETVTSSAGAAPQVVGSDAALATVLAPSSGEFVLRLTVTDDTGARDTADVTIRAATSGGSTTTTSPPPTTSAQAGGGGGALGAELALLLSLLAGARLRQRRAAR